MCIALFPSLNFGYSCIIQFELVQLKIPNYKQITLADVRSPFRTTVGESVTKFWPRKCFTAVILIPAVFLRFFFCLFVFLYRCFKNILNDLIYARCYHPAETKLWRRKKKINRLFYAPLDKTNIRISFLFFHCCSEHVSNYFPESAKTKEISIFHCLVSGKFHRYTLFPFEARQ